MVGFVYQDKHLKVFVSCVEQFDRKNEPRHLFQISKASKCLATSCHRCNQLATSSAGFAINFTIAVAIFAIRNLVFKVDVLAPALLNVAAIGFSVF